MTDESELMRCKRNNRFQSLDLIRSIACVSVMYSHTFYGGGKGAVAINLFFVMSGYLIMQSTQMSGEKGYWKKRLTKIVPFYWMMTIFTALAVYLFPFLFRSYAYRIDYLIKSLLFIPYEHNGINQPLLGLGWTLNYEMMFYFLFWVAMKISYKSRGILTVVLLTLFSMLSTICNLYSVLFFARFYGKNTYLIEFGYGILAFELFNKKISMRKFFTNNSNKSINVLYFLFVLVSIGIMTNIGSYLSVNNYSKWEGIANGFFSFCVLVFGLFLEHGMSKINFISWFANKSYYLYLMHIYPIRFVDTFFEKLFNINGIFVSFIGIALTIITLIVCLYFGDKMLSYSISCWLKNYFPTRDIK